MTEDEKLRIAVSEAMHKADCGCADYSYGDDAYYDKLADAALGVIRPELERLRASEVRQ